LGRRKLGFERIASTAAVRTHGDFGIIPSPYDIDAERKMRSKTAAKIYERSMRKSPSIEKLISGWVASHAEVNLAKRYLEVTLTNIFQDIDMLPTVNYNVNALPMRRIGQH